jgi:hypothetical protein
MRTLFGILVGFLLAIGAAYVHDDGVPQGSQLQLANWDVLGNVARETAAVRRLWDDTIGTRKPA